MPQKQALTEIIKEEVLADLNRSSYSKSQFPAGSLRQPDPALVSSIKADVLAELEAEQKTRAETEKREKRFSDAERELIKLDVLRQLEAEMGKLGAPSGGFPGEATVDRVVVDNIKHELLRDLESRRYGPPDGWKNILSDRNIDRRLDQQYSNLRSLRQEIRRGLEAARDTERRLANIRDPQIREAVSAIIGQAQQEGVPLDQVINRLNTGRSALGWGQRLGGWFGSGVGRGFLGGVGVSLAVALLFPAARGGLRTIGVKMMEGTIDLAGQTRSAFGRAKEGFEDMIAEANFNSLQENVDFPPSRTEPPTIETSSDENPLHQ